jgi:carbon-monoxide dehydrogenase large subunit
MTVAESASPEGVGASVLRREDDRHLHGRGVFVADMKLPGQQEVLFVRSPLARGKIRRISVPEDVAGRVYVHADLEGLKPIVATSTLPGYRTEWYALAREKVRFVGEPVAVVIAADRAEAEGLAERIELDIDELLAVVTAAALEGDAPRIHEEWSDNRFVSLDYEGDDEGLIRVIAPDVGGGFGYKLILQPEELCVAWLALKYRRPFRYVEDRREHLIAGANTRQHAYDLTGYADNDGTSGDRHAS